MSMRTACRKFATSWASISACCRPTGRSSWRYLIFLARDCDAGGRWRGAKALAVKRQEAADGSSRPVVSSRPGGAVAAADLPFGPSHAARPAGIQLADVPPAIAAEADAPQ